jgi:hypothetical protein
VARDRDEGRGLFSRARRLAQRALLAAAERAEKLLLGDAGLPPGPPTPPELPRALVAPPSAARSEVATPAAPPELVLPEDFVDTLRLVTASDGSLVASWELTEAARADARRVVGEGASLVLRCFTVVPRLDLGLDTATVDHVVQTPKGELPLGEVGAGGQVTAAVGLRATDGRFAPIAHSPRLRIPLS